ncbi:uncharacterized protein BX663DRAFT_502086 [Cokeromyces recurvatus]|uniref:uncharacterized protein n=1 Tax=Cokeromyces recurvatus TaxID=90255 RepID=UPI00221E7A59|nr:uncharacterized protein BX663DRAFT_502086 [Cokeromyces recurvatus]KAI7905197.1 hypothetical protein BX663DRAFT_502086 [Cokeromyces recurvatus]
MTSNHRFSNHNEKNISDDDNSSIDLVDSDDSTSQYTPRQRPVRRKVSMATRRHSRMLYLEKYGLNQPNWHSSTDDYDQHTKSENEEEQVDIIMTDEPESITPATFAPNTQTIVDIPVKRPVSIRNFVQHSDSQKRPAQFIKPSKSEKIIDLPPTEFTHVHKLIKSYTQKVYMEGYLHKRNDLNSKGSTCSQKKWYLWYVELCGPVLTLWDATEPESGKEVYPQYINITDSTVTVEKCLTAETRDNLFSLNSAGANRFLLQANDTESLYRWISAIRLSCFECSRIQEIYTRAFITRSHFSSLLISNKENSFVEGFVQVRLPGATGWKKYWAVASNYKIEKRLFTKKVVPTDGQIMFFESRKAKYPIMAFENVVQAYTVYPESPKLINLATLFKVEGSLYKNKMNGSSQQLISTSSSALIMTSTTNELVQWLVGLYDVFKLYGRPGNLLDNPKDPKALNFGDLFPRENDVENTQRLFLEPQEVSLVDVGYQSSLLANKKEFVAILQQKLVNKNNKNVSQQQQQQQQQHQQTLSNSSSSSNPNDHSGPLPSSTYVTNGRRLSARTLIPNQLRHNNVSNTTQPTQLRTVTCASDVSDEEDEDSLIASDNSDNESLYKLSTGGFKLPTTKPLSTKSIDKVSITKPITPNTSKSSSEISTEVSPTTATNEDLFLPTVMDIMSDQEHNFADSLLAETSNYHSNKPGYSMNKKGGVSSEEGLSITSSESSTNYKNNKVTVPKSSSAYYYHSQQPRGSFQGHSTMQPWTTYSSAGSVIERRNNWETSSVDPYMMMGEGDTRSFFSSHEAIHLQQYQQPSYYSSSLPGDDTLPAASIALASENSFITRNSLMDQVDYKRKVAKKMERNARASGQPMVHVPVKKSPPRAGLMGIIEEKGREKRTNNMPRAHGLVKDEQPAMHDHWMMDQRQIMAQQCYPMNGGMMPMMMPVMEPPMMPMMDPRMMSQNLPQNMMGYNPHIMSSPPMAPMMQHYGPMSMSSPTINVIPPTSNSRSRHSQQPSTNDKHTHTRRNRAISSEASISNSIHSNITNSKQTSISSKRNRNYY